MIDTGPASRAEHGCAAFDVGPDALADPTASQFLDALLRADRARAVLLAEQAVRNGRSVTDVHLHLVQASLARIGRLWEQGRIAIAVEHTATAIAQYVITCLYPLMPQVEEWRGRVLLAGVRGEMHQLGGHLVADALEADGWQVRFLGADCPQVHIVAACRSFAPRVLGLSCTMESGLAEVCRVIAAVRRKARPAKLPRILLGGQAFGSGPQARDLARRLGADAVAGDLSEAVALARPWSAARAPGGPDRPAGVASAHEESAA
jgi:MerR family transcriptional regulator, light-induced transcriptional regulator